MAMVMENQQPLARMPPLVPPAPPPPPPPLPQAYKHRCRVCKKGFMCGRALGGHMRAHGVADDDDGLSADDGDDSGPGGGGGSSEAAASAPASSTAATAKRMSSYALRANPGRLKNCRVCENCGKEFTSWKSLLDHGRCNYDEEDGDLDGGDAAGNDDDGEEVEDLALAAGWSKGKRTRRAKVMMAAAGNNSSDEQVPAPSTEEEDLANFLVMLSSSSSSTAARPHGVVEVDQESCTARRKAEQRNHQLLVPQPISMVAPTPPPQVVMPQLLAPPQVVQQQQQHNVSTVPRGMFECKACKKVFTSHQALGGHRASHKKVKGCFAAKLESNRSDNPPQPVATSGATDSNVKVVNDAAIPAIVRTEQKTATTADGNAEGCTTINAGTAAAGVVMATAAPEMAVVMQQVDEVPVAAPSAAAPFKKKGKVHECSICHRVFMSGQALGGHKRCHWLTTGAAGDPMAKLQPFVTQDHVMHAMCQQLTLGRPMFDASDPFLDLNVPTNAAAAEPAAAAARQAAAEMNDGVLGLNAPASLYMHSWAAAGHSNASNMNNTATSGHYDATEGTTVTEDEADSTSAKRAKISDLRDMNMAGETSPWLQVGIGLPSEINEKQATHEA